MLQAVGGRRHLPEDLKEVGEGAMPAAKRRELQAEGAASAKALRQACAWATRAMTGRPAWQSGGWLLRRWHWLSGKRGAKAHGACEDAGFS